MKLAKSCLMGTGAVVLAGLVLSLIAPKAAHALAATLVQVTNTPANPAITQSVPSQAAQLVHLSQTTIGGQTSTFVSILPNGTLVPGYVVPANQYLVIASADVTAFGCPATSVYLEVGNQAIQQWNVSGANTAHFDYPSGIVLAPGSTPSEIVSALSTCGASLQMTGYLTSN